MTFYLTFVSMALCLILVMAQFMQGLFLRNSKMPRKAFDEQFPTKKMLPWFSLLTPLFVGVFLGMWLGGQVDQFLENWLPFEDRLDNIPALHTKMALRTFVSVATIGLVHGLFAVLTHVSMPFSRGYPDVTYGSGVRKLGIFQIGLYVATVGFFLLLFAYFINN